MCTLRFTYRLTYLAPLARAQFLVLSSFFFLLTICFFSRMLNWISTKLGQNDQWVSGYKIYQQFDLKGHVGVTGVKKVNHVKNMKTALISKLIMSSCRQQTKLQKSQWWPCHTTPHIGVKGQNVSYFQFFKNATLPTYYIAQSRNLVRMTSGLVATKDINSLTSKVM